MDVKCERRFPFPVPATPRIHLVAVATGAREAAARQLRGDGSLLIDSTTDGSRPFSVGDLDGSRDFVHVFDDVSLTALMRELDTASDFVSYLGRKAAFIRAGRTVVAERELDLLAHYLVRMDDSGLHDFTVPPEAADATTLVFAGDWEPFERSGPYRRKKAADAPSYLWDRIINEIGGHTERGTLVFGQERGLAGNEPNLRVLASENRFSRRLLAAGLVAVRRAGAIGDENVRLRTVLSRERADRAYVFACIRREVDYDEYRRMRQGMLQAHLLITKFRRESLRQVIGLAVSPDGDPEESVDMAVGTFDEWTDADREGAAKLCDALGWSRETAHLETHAHFDEYPASPDHPERGAPTTHSRVDTDKAGRKKRKAQRAARRATRRR